MNTQTLQAKIGDREISYLLRKRTGHAVLFLHGLGCSKESFTSAFDHGVFPEDLTLIAPDLIGHGESSQPPDDSYSLEAHSECVLRLLEEFELRDLVVVGHSMGGAIGLMCASQLRSLVAFFCLEGNLIGADCAVARKIVSVSELHFVQNLFPFAPLRFRCTGSSLDPPCSPVAFYRSARSLVEWSDSERLFAMFKTLHVAKTYIFGSKNARMPILSRLGDVEAVPIEGCGHFMLLERPDETYRAILDRI
jgi:pimeloyl-ACP methyl ester carboxylesterase